MSDDEQQECGPALTAEEIREIDEIGRDKAAVNAALEIAINYASNRLSKLRKLEQEWWNKALGARGLPVGRDVEYEVANASGPIVHIKTVKKDEKR